MRKFLIVVAVGAVSYCDVAHGFLFAQNNYCLQPYVPDGTGNMPCKWCAASGVTDNGTCKAGYASCLATGADIVSVGNSVSDANGDTIKCTQSGWCYTSCSGNGHWDVLTGYIDGSVEVWYSLSGCQCDSYLPDTSKVRCAAGWYGVPDRYTYEGCQPCPGFGTLTANSLPGTYGPDDMPDSEESVIRLNADISSCFIEPGEYSDDTGTGVLTDNCCYDGTSDCVNVPVRPPVRN